MTDNVELLTDVVYSSTLLRAIWLWMKWLKPIFNNLFHIVLLIIPLSSLSVWIFLVRLKKHRTTTKLFNFKRQEIKWHNIVTIFLNSGCSQKRFSIVYDVNVDFRILLSYSFNPISCQKVLFVQITSNYFFQETCSWKAAFICRGF